MECHIIAFFMGFLLDFILGDPYSLPHPVRFMGLLIEKTEKWIRNGEADRTGRKEFYQGMMLTIFVLGITGVISTSFLFLAYSYNALAGIVVETIMTWQMLAVKSLRMESMKVYRCLKQGQPENAKDALSMIVGRDTEELDEEGIAKAAIETIAENTSDGVIAPMLYAALGGPVSGFLYKAINTMDSMLGYKNEKYLYFGRAAAKLDDLVNYIPARVSAGLMIIAAFLGGKEFSGKRAYTIFKRDRYQHASPNSAQTESVCAGALGIRLAGDASYFGKLVKKPYIGDAYRAVGAEDIRLANKLMILTACLGEGLCLILLCLMTWRG